VLPLRRRTQSSDHYPSAGAAGAAIVLRLVFVVLYDLGLHGLLLADHEQRISQALYSIQQFH
jgi:hypothetical protein